MPLLQYKINVEVYGEIMNEALISVIVPIYNVEPYLEMCIDSIINQTYKQLEIILVDDGSTDRSGTICDAYAEIDSRVRVIHKENGGPSDTRNEGLRVASGDYIMFVDNDDFVADDICAVLLANSVKFAAEISTCAHIPFWDSQADGLLNSNDTGQVTICDNCAALKIYFAENSLPKNRFHTVNVAKLYAQNLFDNIEFPVTKLHEDLFTTYQLLYAAKTCVSVDVTKYYYRQRADSIMGQANNTKNIKYIIEAFEERYRFFAERCSNLAQYAGRELFGYYLYCFKLLTLTDKIQGEDIQYLTKTVENKIHNFTLMYPEILLRPKHRFCQLLFRINPSLYTALTSFRGKLK